MVGVDSVSVNPFSKICAVDPSFNLDEFINIPVELAISWAYERFPFLCKSCCCRESLSDSSNNIAEATALELYEAQYLYF